MDQGPWDRLRAARQKAGYKTPADFVRAHRRHHIRLPTYTSHEANPQTNTSARNPKRTTWELYSRLLGVSVHWLIAGEGSGPGTLPARIGSESLRLFLTLLVERYSFEAAAESEFAIAKAARLIAARANAIADIEDMEGRLKDLSAALQASVQGILQSQQLSPAPPDDLERCAALFPSLLQVLPPLPG